jgi:multidrug efflux pump subunit AcrA (membrane-fusion protein)
MADKTGSTLKVLAPVVVLCLGLGLAVLLWLARKTPAPKAADPLPVAVMTLDQAEGFARKLRFTGTVAPRQETALAFEVTGRLVDVLADDGDRVTAGAPVARLETERLESRIGQLEAQREDARAQAALAAITAQRQKALLEAGHVPPQANDEARFRADAARARVARITAELEQARIDLRDSTLYAPFDAVIVERALDEGSVVDPGAPILRMQEDGALEARIGIPARFFAPCRAWGGPDAQPRREPCWRDGAAGRARNRSAHTHCPSRVPAGKRRQRSKRCARYPHAGRTNREAGLLGADDGA